MTHLSTDRIFELLPAFLRLADAEEGRQRRIPGDPRDVEDFGPLRTLASLIAREAQIVDEGLDDHYDNAFIETCAPWVIPYLGELLGVRGLADIPEGIDMRARVANALDLRARKGTLGALEQAASDSSGWPVHAVEFWKRLNHAQTMRLPHLSIGLTIDTRSRPDLARLDTAFERTARNVDVRRIETQGGRWNLGNIGFYLWRLKPVAITRHRVRPVTGRRDFRFHPLQCDAQLFTRPDPATDLTHPAAIARSVMAEDPANYVGDTRSLRIWVGGVEVDPSTICAANLGSRATPGAPEPEWTRTGGIPGLTLVDPELGRLVIDPDLAGPVDVSCHFAQALELGGGEHERAPSIGTLNAPTIIAPSTEITGAINGAGGSGVFLLDRSTHYAANGTVTVPANQSLRLVAANGAFPTIRMGNNGLRFALGDDATLELNGVRLTRRGLSVTGAGAEVSLIDCTLVPGLELDISGLPVAPASLSLDCQIIGAALRLDRCITGPIEVAEDMDIRLGECILDAGSADAIAFAPALGAERVTAGFDRCTILGRVRTSAFADGTRIRPAGFGVATGANERLATSDTLFFGRTDPAVEAAFRQVGCIRFSYVPPGAVVPRLYRCVRSPEPIFESTRYTDPAYMVLDTCTDTTLLRGAENGDQMGAYNRAAWGVRGDNIRRAIDDFLRFGHAAGAFNET
ncbi:MAG: phage tail protein [Pseudomonadota bacterium]